MKNPKLKLLDRLIGSWKTEATHPMLPGVVVHGTVTVEWLEGEQFQIHRGRTDHPDFPDSISIVGFMDQDRINEKAAEKPDVASDPPLRMQYFDSRGVYRLNESSIDEVSWKWWRVAKGFSQRFTGTFTEGGRVIDGLSQLRRDDVHWVDDLKITYRRED